MIANGRSVRHMAAYITLISFTEQGVRNVKDTGKRADAIT